MYYNPMTNNTNYMYNNAGMYQQGIPASPMVYQQPIGYGINYGGYYQQPMYQQPLNTNQQQLQNYNLQMNMLMHKTPDSQQQVQLTPLYSQTQEQTNPSVDLAAYTRQSINNDIAKLQAYANQVSVNRPNEGYQNSYNAGYMSNQMYQQQQFNEAYQKQLALNQMIAQNQYRENMMASNQIPIYSGLGNMYQQPNYDAYNPYLQYQNFYIEQNREALNTQVNILQRLYKASCCYNGTEVDQDNLDYIRGLYFPNEKKNEYDGYRNIPPALMERKRYLEQLNANSAHLMNANLTDCTGKNPELVPYINYINNLYTEYRNKIPNNVGMIEYFNKYASDDYMDALNSEYMKKVQNLTNAYNSAAYKESIASNKIPIYGRALQDPNMIRGLEDVEVKLPTYISDATRQERRAQFIASLMSKGEL